MFIFDSICKISKRDDNVNLRIGKTGNKSNQQLQQQNDCQMDMNFVKNRMYKN